MYSGFSSPMALANSRIFSTPTQKASSYGKALPTYSRFSAIRWGRLASFLVLAVAPAVRAKLFDLQPIRVVAPVLAGDVVAVLTLFARQGDLGADVGGGHGSCLFLDCRVLGRSAGVRRPRWSTALRRSSCGYRWCRVAVA